MLWKSSLSPIPYPQAVEWMEDQVRRMLNQRKTQEDVEEILWFLEHVSVYTVGTSGDSQDILKENVPVYIASRGGKVTYHGPGQRVVYALFNLERREKDLRRYIFLLEEVIIDALRGMDIEGYRRSGCVGVWVVNGNCQEEKIASIGVRVRQWMTFHGIALNVSPDLMYFQGIIPCGLSGMGVTSVKKILGYDVTYKEVDAYLRKAFCKQFNVVE